MSSNASPGRARPTRLVPSAAILPASTALACETSPYIVAASPNERGPAIRRFLPPQIGAANQSPCSAAPSNSQPRCSPDSLQDIPTRSVLVPPTGLPLFGCATNLPKFDDLLANILALALFWAKAPP